MKKFFLVVAFSVLSSGCCLISQAATIHCTNTSNLHAAVASAGSGDILELAAGSYYPTSTLVIRVNMTIKPDASSAGAVHLYGSYVPAYDPILLVGETSRLPVKVTIHDIDFAYADYGVSLCNANKATISDSNFKYFKLKGLESGSNCKNVILDNLYFYSAPSYAAGSNVELKNSTFEKSKLLFTPYNGLVTSCSFSESSLNLYGADYVKVDDNQIYSSSPGILVSYGDFIEIVSNTIEFCDIGIEQMNISPHLEIHRNTIINNEFGIYLWSDDNVLGVDIDIHDNTINQNDTGIYMTSMDASTAIHANWMAKNDLGVYAEQCADPQVYNNLIINGGRGFVGVSTDVYFVYNTVANNFWGGVLSSTNDSSFINNNISWGNLIGISKESSSTAYVLNNVAYKNRSSDFFGSISSMSNYSIDPMFRNPFGDDYHLTSASGCLGIALYLSVSKDMDGLPREPISGRGTGPKYGADVGCYESYLMHNDW